MAYQYEFKPSPNYTTGRRSPITTIVIHWMVGTLSSTDAVFSRRSSGVSAHYGIENNKVHQYVRERDTAWHAISANPFSIGIEHSAAPGRSATDATYKTSAELIAQICTERKIPVENIQPHCKYVQTRCPGTDVNGTVDEAGGIDIGRIKNDVRAILGARTPVPVPAKRPFVRYLRIGSHGSDVDFVHHRLASKGFYKAAFDSHFGPLTDKAVRAFQRSRGLVADGWCGPLTWSALQD